MGTLGGFGSGSQGTMNPVLSSLLMPPAPTSALGNKGGGGGFFGGLAQGMQSAAPSPNQGILEALNQQFNRPDAMFQGPIAPVGGVRLISRLKGSLRGLF